MTLRERKKAQTWEAIHEVAARAVLERGLGAVTVEQIAAAVGISPRTFFNYFPTKDHAVLGLREPVIDEGSLAGLTHGPELLAQVVDVLNRTLQSSVPAKDRSLRLSVLREHRELVGLHKHNLAVAEDKVRVALLDRVADRARGGTLVEDAEHPTAERVRLLVMIASAILRYVWTDPHREPGTEPTEDDVERAVDLYKHLNRTDFA